MAVFNDFELTNAGINLLGQVSTGQPLIFTKIKLGDGNFIGNVKYLTDLFSTFKELNISDIIIQEDGSINIKSEFNNDGFSTSKEWKEIGIFAKAGESGTEVLYSYSYSLLTVETIPDETIPYRRDLNFRNYISDVTNVTYDITIKKDKYDFDSDVAMQSASYLVEGDRVNVWKADSCQKRRISTINNDGILLNNGLYANLILDIQGKYDSSLATISKYVIPAINECTNDKTLGSDIEGAIEGGTLHQVGETWYSSANEKYYECFEENSDNFVNTLKWKERSIDKNAEDINDFNIPHVLYDREDKLAQPSFYVPNINEYKTIILVYRYGKSVALPGEQDIQDYYMKNRNQNSVTVFSNNSRRVYRINWETGKFLSAVNEFGTAEYGGIIKVIGYKN